MKKYEFTGETKKIGFWSKTVIRESCIGNFLGIECIKHCSECYKWWDDEYKEPEMEKEE